MSGLSIPMPNALVATIAQFSRHERFLILLAFAGLHSAMILFDLEIKAP
jgi:hypothetical protein